MLQWLAAAPGFVVLPVHGYAAHAARDAHLAQQLVEAERW